ncbi:hypothetical protein [Aeromicrobium sp. 179-A 4D2 NHS]|uniref:hypothetical protein n=1 Tax=Aeromicrobium sp. 179-A 4D2 NHS TaxID=3142375 RepID=UPI0039A1DC92
MSTKQKVADALAQYENVVRTGLGTSRTEDMLADALKAVLAEQTEAIVGVNRAVLIGAAQASIIARVCGEDTAYWGYISGDSVMAADARRFADAVEETVVGVASHVEPYTTSVNPVLRDALIYRNERMSMDDPKDWAHVVRVVKRAVAGGVYVGVATPNQIEKACAALDEIAEAEANGQAS